MNTSQDETADPARTRRQNPTPPNAAGATTRRQGPAQRHDTDTATHAEAAVFPTELSRSYHPLDLLGTGAEGAVWRVHDVRTHAELALKVHWDNQPMDHQLLAHLDNSAFHRHVPAITASGRLTTSAGTRDWVAMEYLPTNLADTVTQLEPSATAEANSHTHAVAIVAELAALIAFWQTHIDRNPLDFKPANILVRTTGNSPGQFVIADFGGIHRFTASQLHGGASHFNLAYAPPEHTWSEHATPWPWWGLGEIAYELACGHPRYRRRDGAVKADTEIVRGQILGERGTAIPDERWSQLVRGLLTLDPADRWGHTEVQDWVQGGLPAVADQATQAPATAATSRARLTFGRLELTDPAEVAAHLVDQGQDAARWLLTEGGAHQLATYLDQLNDHTYDTTQLHHLEGSTERAHLAVTALGATFAPQLTPTYAGQPADVDGLIELAGTQPARLQHLLAYPEALRTIAVYDCGHPECGRLPRCDRMQRLAAEAPQLVNHAQQDAEALGEEITTADATGQAPTTLLSEPLSDAEREHAHALATLAVLDPARLRSQIEQSRASALLGPHWWRRLVLGCNTSDTPTGRRAMITTMLLADRAATERAQLLDRQASSDYAKSLWHRVVTGVLSGLALINAVWAGIGSFDDIGNVLASVFPLVVATATLVALWPWRSAEMAPRVLTALTWTTGLVFALIYRGLDGAPPDTARLWWPAPDWLVGFMGLLPGPFHVMAWWFPIIVATTVVILAIKFVRLRMRLAYRQRYVNFWHAPRVGPSPEDRLGLGPLIALTWLGILTVGAVTAGIAHSSDTTITLALPAPPLAYLAVFMAAGVGLLFLPARHKLLLWVGMAVLAAATCGWIGPLRLIEVLQVGPLQAMWLVLLGLTMLCGAAYYIRTRLTPLPEPSL